VLKRAGEAPSEIAGEGEEQAEESRTREDGSRLGIRPKMAWQRVYEGHQSIWALNQNPAVERGLRNAYFAERGLVTLLD
jgi:hypothetical protein